MNIPATFEAGDIAGPTEAELLGMSEPFRGLRQPDLAGLWRDVLRTLNPYALVEAG